MQQQSFNNMTTLINILGGTLILAAYFFIFAAYLFA